MSGNPFTPIENIFKSASINSLEEFPGISDPAFRGSYENVESRREMAGFLPARGLSLILSTSYDGYHGRVACRGEEKE